MKNIFSKNLSYYFYVVMIAGILAGCARTAPMVPELKKPSPQIEMRPGIYHEVQRGQTLWRIAKEYGTDINVLAQANQIRDYTALEEGQLVFVPGATRRLDVSIVPRPVSYAKVTSERRFFNPIRNGSIAISFGEDKGRIKNKGVDIRAAEGSSVMAVKTGVVTFSDVQMRGLGCVLVIDHQDGYSTVYAHLSKSFVKEGDVVKQGQEIGRVGISGDTSLPTLHFEVRHHGKAIDPMKVLPRY